MNLTRESIFVSSIRSFCVALGGVLGVLGGACLLFLLIGFFSGSDLIPDQTEASLVPDANGSLALLPPSHPAILRIDIRGVIGGKDINKDNLESILLDSREGLLKNDRVKGVFIYMDSPGGTVTDADAIYRALIAYKKKYQVPIYVYVDGLCASGGMYIASAADKIYASDSSVIGSIGVIVGPYFNFSSLMERYGVTARTLTEGKDKDMLSPWRPWKPQEDQSLVDVTSFLYSRFVSIVTTARPQLDKLKLINEYGAQVFDAPKAMRLGYIDTSGSTYAEALNALTAAAQIPETQDYQVVLLEAKKPFFSQFAEGKCALLSGKISHSFQITPYLSEEMSGKFLYLYQPAH